jgi:uncharacterized protein YaiI (UPF0178 family)
LTDIYIDAEFCSVQDDVFRIARRFGLAVYVVSTRPVKMAEAQTIRPVVVDGAAAADQWIVEHTRPNDIAITVNSELATRLMEKGVRVLGSNGEIFGAECRDKIRELAGPERVTSANPAGQSDHTRKTQEGYYFAAQLVRIIQAIRRG